MDNKAPFNPQEELRESNAQKLGDLLKLLNITEAFYVDDYNRIDILPIIVTSAKKLFIAEKIQEIHDIFPEGINVNVPDEDSLGDEIYKLWEDLNHDQKEAASAKVLSLEGSEFNILDYSRTKELQKSFPRQYLKLINPDEWEATFKDLEKKYDRDGKVLILFDQDLNKAEGEKFKNGTVKGQHLILHLKNSSIKDNVYCALITHLISDTSQELTERNKIIENLNEQLKEKDFFALTKERIKTPELLCDGIKKALLNGYCEEIKEHSESVIKDAQESALKRIITLDTYDFDHTVLRSSYSEGVWEIDTLFRIAGNIYNDEVKKIMADSNYAKNVNPHIKKAKTISDVRFTIDPETLPYKQKYSLRHQDIYEHGDTINRLHYPLANGDIFEITAGKGRGFYILIGQECDLMIRTDPNGSRSADTATLLKIQDLTRLQLDEIIMRFYENDVSDNHFYSNKFRLDYFKFETNDIGLVKFSNAHVVNLDILDLCVFSTEGKVNLDLTTAFDVDLVSTSWEQRYRKVVDVFGKNADSLDKLLPEINKLSASIRDQIKKRITIKLAPITELGRADNYSSRRFDFGVKRIMRLKTDGAKYLLDRYFKHLSRTAEQHDFARADKIIKVNFETIHENQEGDRLHSAADTPSQDRTMQNSTRQE